MKIEKINEDVIKITLTDEDFRNRSLDANFEPDEKVLIDAIYHAEIEFDFDVSECHVLYEPATSKGTDHIITITRTQNAVSPPDHIYELNPALLFKSLDFILDLLAKEDYSPDYLHLEEIQDREMTSRLITIEEDDRLFEVYDDFENLLALVQARPESKTIPAFLYSYNKNYYIVYKLSRRNLKAINQLRSSITEFDGRYIHASLALPILEEYGSKIIKRGAFSVLQKKFIHR